MSLELAKGVLTTEAEAILRLRGRLDAAFLEAVELLVACQGRVVWTAMGKSGIICRKLAATMASTGTPAMFLHPARPSLRSYLPAPTIASTSSAITSCTTPRTSSRNPSA